MGLGAFSVWKLVIVLAIILLLFGTGRLRTLGADLGGALRGFKSALGEGHARKEGQPPNGQA